MRNVKLLLVNADWRSNFTVALREMLDASTNSALNLRPEVFEQNGDIEPDGLAQFASELKPDLCILMSKPPARARAAELLAALKAAAPAIPIIIGLKDGAPEHFVEFLNLGAVDFITPPLRATDVLPRIWRLTEDAPGAEAGPLSCVKRQELKHLIGNSEAFLTEVNKIPIVARCDAGVLITGETGTGKELCARALHYLSLRSRGPFVPVNCGSIPHDLVENELFGHKPGAYTGASTSEFGLVHEADGGTLFLDEVDCLPLQSQVKLLRFLQDKVYKPLGTSKVCEAYVRVVAAMNVDAQESVSSGRLRRDLYYRLNVIPLHLPPLRERREDILLLAYHFLAKYASEFDKPARDFTAATKRALNCYDWPGNVRELEHVIERAVIFSDRPLIAVDVGIAGGEGQPPPESFNEAKAKLIRQFERTYLQDLLLTHHGNVSRAARAAHKNRRVLWQLIRKHHIDVQRFRAGVA